MRYPQALWIGPTPNETPNGMIDVHGLVLHIQQGTEVGSEAWFTNPDAQASSHFLNPKTGILRQMVDTRDKAWAEVSGNSHWISVENEGNSGDSLTDSQLKNLQDLFGWIHQNYDTPYQSTDDVMAYGIGWHGMGGNAWGGHFDCPGDPINNARPKILSQANFPPPNVSPWPGVYMSMANSGGHYDSRVAHFQQRMFERGWKSMVIDGWFGKITDGIVRQFQQEKGLTVDGIVGPKTWDTAFRTDNVT